GEERRAPRGIGRRSPVRVPRMATGRKAGHVPSGPGDPPLRRVPRLVGGDGLRGTTRVRSRSHAPAGCLPRTTLLPAAMVLGRTHALPRARLLPPGGCRWAAAPRAELRSRRRVAAG